MNIDAKILSKIPVNYIHQHIKRIIKHHKVKFIPEIQVNIKHTNKIKGVGGTTSS